ncbi:hypothetical protein IH981_04425 [Patescibacteria group bacterium]|nr:hypothetical protein [Patescibacteria group bacterium]
MAAKELSWEFITETGKQKYILVKKSENEHFVFRTPGVSTPSTKESTNVSNWEGEIVRWGSIPKKIRRWVLRKRIKPSPEDQKTLISVQNTK